MSPILKIAFAACLTSLVLGACGAPEMRHLAVVREGSTEPLDAGGIRVEQIDNTVALTIPDGTRVPADGFLVIGRQATREAFEACWSPLGDGVVYLNGTEVAGGDGFPQINGGERYRVVDAEGHVQDPATGGHLPENPIGKHHNYQRDATDAAAFTERSNARENATPGRYDGARRATGHLVVTEISDAADFKCEFVELHFDTSSGGPPPPPHPEPPPPHPEPPPPTDPCHTPGLYDSHVLAISWQPAFCETKRNKPECKVTDPERFDSSHFALHGLWPNKNSCGTGYGFCGSVHKQARNFCDYPVLDLRDGVRQALGRIMPSARREFCDPERCKPETCNSSCSCLQRHEYWKHGTCRASDPNVYFLLAIDLMDEINDSSFVREFVQPNIGKVVSRDDFLAAFDASFGAGAHRHVDLSCSRGQLVEMKLYLPRDIDAETPLGELLKDGPSASPGCGDSFEIDPVGF